MRTTRTAALLGAALFVAGCFQGKSSKAAEAGQEGQLGVFYLVNVSRPVGGTITTPDGQLNCGTNGTGKDACGPATFSWNVSATLSAVPDAGKVFVQWAGDCGGAGACVLDTKTNGADKWVVAVFNPTNSVGHAPIPDPAQHGPLFFDFVKKVPTAPKCNTCHGPEYKGLANAPSCEACHAAAGFPDFLNNCGFCHGDPPAVPHVQLTTCSACHQGYGDNTGSGVQATNKTTHMNGAVDVSGAACTACHGTNDVNPAPPVDTHGGSATSLVSVGAHQVHLNTTIAKPVACGECHVVPSDVSHATNPPASKVKFGALANQGTTTVWNAGAATCSSTYCHGGSTALAGGQATTPVWTAVDGTQKACTSCHGAPPPSPHPNNADCATCHTGYTVVQANAATHVDGVVNVRVLTCSSCHGDALRTGLDPYIAAAPPRGTNGETTTTQPAVGAHIAHLSAGSLSRAFACTDCHNPPTAMTHANGAVEFSFSVLAGGTSVAYDTTAHTCSNTYCHGNFPGGKPTNAPVWTAGIAGAACGSCHGVPPAAPHSQSTACGGCHAGYTATSVNTTAHVNGIVDVVALSCTSCHGSLNVNAAPPLDTHGGNASTLVSVGAHQGHVTTTLMASPIACTECHGATSANYGTSHADGTVQIQFGSRSNQGTATVWNRTAASCSASYCHGGTFPTGGGTATLPTWTRVDGTQKTCTSCHGAPPPSPHVASSACGSCHPGYTSNTVAAGSHINGTVDVVLGPTSCNVCHGSPPATPDHRTAGGITTCASCHDQTVDSAGNILASGKHRNGVTDLSLAMNCGKCHGTVGRAANPTSFSDEVEASPPRDLAGNATPTAPGVGAHLVHVNGLRSKNLFCSDCHDVSSVMTALYSHANGSVDMAWGTLATAGGVTPTYVLGSGSSCNATYCHGNFTGGKGPGASPAWTLSGTLPCTSCHDAPPALSATTHHPGNTNCGACHGTGYASTTVVQATHVDGMVTLSRSGCTLCHGDLTQTAVAPTAAAVAPGFNAASADTRGNTLATAAAVGAHAAHLVGTRWRAATIACNECHVIPGAADVSHATGVGSGGARATVRFGALATTGGVTTAGYSGSLTGAGGTTAGTCSNTYCHGNFKNGSSGNVPSWLGGVAGADCGSCHGLPPGGTHPANSSCGTCHTGYTASSVNVALHLNGAVDVNGSSCTSCHGGVNPAPPADTHGGTATTLASVGAHQAHVASTLGTPIACTECHGAASGSYTMAHPNGAVDLAWGTLATTGGTAPTYTLGSGGSCSATYCHGGFAGSGAAGTSPTWVTAGTLACNSCHGAPPALSAQSHHPANANCATCHGAGYSATTVVQATHVDGTVNVSRTGCTVCHGDLTQTGVAASSAAAAPGFNAAAADTTGATAATSAAVGAHAAHLTGTRWRATALACSECHTAPPAGDVAHATGTGSGGARATVTFGALATTNSITTASYAGSTTGTGGNGAGSCSNVYCHGNFKNGATTATVSWLGGVAAAACGSCHGLPPGGTHPPTGAACGTCHTGYPVGGVDAAVHMDGKLDVDSLTCTSCHGAPGRTSVAGADLNQASAPPLDTLGATAGVRVGTHASHVNPVVTGAVYKPVACTECHPDNAGNVGHSNSAINVTFATATGANLGSYTATFAQGDGATNQTTCATYCHGSSLNATTTRGSVASWSWNSALPADCGSCHKSPPTTANHHSTPLLTTCVNCHAGTVNASGAVLASGNLHINGAVDVSTLTCTSCHGSTLVATGVQDPNIGAAPRGTGAPDTYGNVTTASAGVGVHAAHVVGSRSRPVLCNACHATVSTPIHKTGSATAGTVLLGNLATNGGAAASYVGTGGTCSNTYCHGTLGGVGSIGVGKASPAWAQATPTALVCVSCHGMPPSATSTGRTHPNRNDCGSCHAGYTGVAVNPTTHVNGTVEYVAQTCTSCHGTTGRAGSDANLVAFDAAPPADSSGASTGAKVGAHAKHLFTGIAGGPSFSKQVACSECHNAAIPATPLHANGAPNVAFGTLARTGTVTPAYTPGAIGTCSNTYCHGNFTNGAGANPITWTAAAMTCTSCHGTPPGGSHPAGSTLATCGNCHGNYSNASSSIIDPAGHVDGSVDLSNMTCTSCHGTVGRANTAIAGVAYDLNQAASPPLDTANLATSARVGTHISHVNPVAVGAVYKPVACSECHPNNTSNAHANTIRDVVFPVGGAARLASYAAGFTLGNGSTQTTCATYCHGASLNATTTLGSVGATWTWNSVVAADCGSCHKLTPTTANHHNAAAATTCATCHSGTVNSSGAILVSGGLHLNGAVDTSTFTCVTCHGGSLVATGNQDPNVGVAPRGAGAPDTYGLTATTARGVGVHASHVLGTRSRPVLCNACHAIPGTPIHKTGPGTTGTVGLANLSVTGGITTASYATTTLTCSNTYCHGSLGGGVGATNVTPAWTAAATLACTACHGAPPTTLSSGGTHPARADCGTCHAGYAGTSAATWTVSNVNHVNGIVEVTTQTCTSCHGTAGRASVGGADLNQASAPPADSHGATTGVLVGMHLAHVNPAASTVSTGAQPTGGVYKPIACTECHPNNSSMTHSDGTVNLDFTLATGAKLNNFAAAFTRGDGATTATTCATWCHGAGLGTSYQGTTTIPAWNGAAASCTSCHDFPPLTAAHTGPPQVASDSKACASCHAGTVNADGTINVAGGKHINGSSDAVKGDTCSSCHDFGMVAATTYHHVMATDPGAAYPVANGPVIADTNRNCNVCHMKHEFTTASANLRNTINSATPTGATTDTALCVSCHQQNVQTKDLTRQKSDGTAQTALIDSAAFTGSAHDYLVDGAFGVNVMQMNCVKCHNSDSTPAIQSGTYKFALHSSADRRLRAPLGRATLTDDDSASFCYRCHSATTDATLAGTKKTLTANDWYGKVTTMPASSTGIYAQMQKGTAGTAAASTTATNTLYLKPTAAENPVEPMPNAHLMDTTFAGGTWIGRSMSPGTTTTAYESKTVTANVTGNNLWRMVTFTSPPVATAVNVPAGNWTINLYDRESNAALNGLVKYAIYKWNAADSVGTTIVAGATAPEMGIIALPGTVQAITVAGAAVSLAVGDKIVVDLELSKNATTLTYTASYSFGSGAPSNVVMPSTVNFTYAGPATVASGRHDVGQYVGKHKPNPAEEHLNFIAANKHVDCADCHDPHRSKRGNQDEVGTYSGATGAAVTTLTDATKDWLPNAFVGYVVDIYTADSATAAARGQITANTATTLTFGLATGSVTPAAGSNRYRISMKNGGGAVSAAGTNTLTSTTNFQWMPNAFAGWYVRIVFGVGIGQSAPILSNTANQVTINGTWTTTPTTASRYVISRMPNVLLGSSGVNVAAWGAGTPTAWGEAKTFSPVAGSTTPLPDATTQWQVCLKCHSGANTALTTWKSSWTDLALEFNPRNLSYHPVIAPSATTSGTDIGNTALAQAQLTNGWKPGDVMTCSDCHGNDSTVAGASQGPHASAVPFILRGPNTRWPKTASGANWTYSTRATGQGTADGLFCLNCHVLTSVHTRGEHNLGCTECHIRIPHGGKVKRLIATTSTPAPYVDPGVTPVMRAYDGGTSSSNCGASCQGGHTAAATTSNSW